MDSHGKTLQSFAKRASHVSDIFLIGGEVMAARGTPPLMPGAGLTPAVANNSMSLSEGVGSNVFGGIYVNVAKGVRWSIKVGASWIKPVQATTGVGPGLFTFRVTPNDGAYRETTLSISGQRNNGKPFSQSHPIRQQAGNWLKEQENQVLAAPFLFVPRVMEFAIASKWIASQINKIPEPFLLIALIIVEILVAVLGISAIAAWTIASPIPVEKPVYPYPDMPTMDPNIPPMQLPLPPLLLEQCPITTAVMAMETLNNMVYIAIHSIEGE